MRARLIRQLPLCFLLGLPLGCENTPTPEPAPSATPQLETAPVASAPQKADRRGPGRRGPRMGGMGWFGGPAPMLVANAHDLGLEPEKQNKLDEIEKSLQVRPTDASTDAMRQLNEALVQGVKDGKIDAAKIAPHYASLDKADEARNEQQSKALGELHTLLSAEQRKKLADSIRAKQGPRTMRPDGGAPRAMNRDAEHAKRQAEQMSKELALDAAQQKKLEGVLAKRPSDGDEAPDPDKQQKQREALLAAFEKDTFDATKEAQAFGKKQSRTRAEARVKHVTAILAIVKADQREALARWVERGSMMGRGGGPGMNRPGGFGRPPMPFNRQP